MDDILELAAAFPAATPEQWLERVTGVLKGADFEKRLVSRSSDGIRIEPLYNKAAKPAPVLRAASGPWRIIQRLDHPEPGAANALALADLEGGADGLAIVYAGAPTARGFGTTLDTVDDLDRTLDGVMLDLIDIRLEPAPFQGRAVAAQWAALARRKGVEPGGLRVDFGLDPVGAAARTGRLPAAWDETAGLIAETSAQLREIGFAAPVLRADSRPWHEAGASEAQELATTLATGVAYLRALDENGHPLASAQDVLSFVLVADADEFLTIAKFRALRRLWARVEQACGLTPQPIRLHAETAWRMTSRRDPWVNLLRGTIAAFAAGIGGADSVAVLPFTVALGLPDAFARRLARNTQLILLEESNLGRVADPASGSGGFEALTEALSATAWSLFQEIEREGGIFESLRAGGVQGRIAAVRAGRERNIARRKDPLTGVSEFPAIKEAPVSVLMAAPPRPPPSAPSHSSVAGGKQVTTLSELTKKAEGGASLSDLAPSEPSAGAVEALPSIRLATPFEELRDASDALLASAGTRPAVFLANLGPIAVFTARASFAGNAFEAGGLEALSNDGFQSPEDAAQAFVGSGAAIACICSSDERYVTDAVAVARALKAAGAVRVGLAGRPGDLEGAVAEAGVDFFVFAGCDLINVLKDLLAAAAGAKGRPGKG